MNDWVRRLKTASDLNVRIVEDRTFESKRVKFLLKQSGAPASAAEDLRRACVERYGSPDLLFEVFHELHPEYPVVLAADRLDGVRLHQDQDCVLPNWFTRFTELPFVGPFGAHLEAVQASRPGKAAGLVFPRVGLVQGLVIHTEVPGVDFGPGACFTFTGSRRGGGRRTLYVRPFSALVDAVAGSAPAPDA